MPTLMYREGAFHDFYDGELKEAIKDGWEDGEPIREAILAKKRAIANPVEVATITAQPEVKRSPGRPKRPSILNDGE